MSAREQWGSQAGFILATIGAAVGLGNIWRFSYIAGENGGGAFLLIYVLSVVLVGLPLVIGELLLGRRAEGDVIATFALPEGGKGWRLAGWTGIAGGVLVLSYYAVIAGWALKYFVGAVTGSLWQGAAAGYGVFFQRFIADPGEPIAWQAVMLGLTMFVVAGGVERGIELANRWLMPLLALIVSGLATYAVMLPGWGSGMAFLFSPDWSALAKPDVYAAALGQAFFSLSLGMAVFLTYGSYMPRTFSLPASAAVIVAGDMLFAILAGAAIFPAVFSFGGNPAAGPELAFITLPQIFLSMPGGAVLGAGFFFLLAAAAFTSMVSLLEVPVAMAVHRFRLGRWKATAICGALIFLAGIPSALSFGTLDHIRIGGAAILDAVDTGVSNFVLPFGGILVALFVGWRLERAISLAESDLAASRLGPVWLWLLRTLVPVAIAVILFRSISAL